MVTGVRVEMTDVCTNGTGNNVCSGNQTYTVSFTGLLNKFITSVPTGTITASTQMSTVVTGSTIYYN